MKIGLWLVVALVTLSSAFAADFYVDNQANGGNSGSSWDNAWQSFSAINWDSIGPGDTIYISGGTSGKTYHERLNPPDTFDGTSGSEITITVGVDPNHNGQVTIDGDSIRNCVELIKNDYVIVGGNAGNSIRCIEGGTGSGSIYAEYGSHFTVQYWEFPDYNTRGMVYVQKDNDNFVISHITGDNVVSSNQNDGIVVQTGGMYTVTDFVIEYVTWRDDNTNANQHIDCMQLGTTNYAVHNGVVRNNHCIQNNNKESNSQGIFTEHFGGVWYVYNNLLEYNTGIPLKFKTDYQGGKIYLYSNTIIKKGVSDRHLARVAGANSVVKNNIFYRADSQQSALNFYDTLTDPTNQVDYNIYYRGGASTSIIDVHGYVVDPSLDSQWRPDSANDPPVDKGLDLSGIFSYDKDGNSRGSSWDIGAYEFGGTPPPTCSQLGGNPCQQGQTCDGGNFQYSSDHGYLCCVGGTCADPAQTCNDGTAYGSCSSNKPLFCQSGNLFNDCQDCGCPSGESCNNDGSCSTQTQCTPGQQQSCSTGQQGICALGTRTCDSSGNWGSCQGPSPQQEICSTTNVDEDCDGFATCDDSDCSGDPFCAPPPPPGGTDGDVNEDGVVDLQDLTIIAIHYGSTSGFPPRADLNNDGRVDIIDLTIVASHFGGTGTSGDGFLPGVIIEAEEGTLESPMQTVTGNGASGSYVHTPTANQGRVSYTFQISTPGQYYLEVKQRSPSQGANSFFIGLDGEQANGVNYYVYDSQESTSFLWDQVSLRGPTGTFEHSDFDPMVWQLFAGQHTFNFYGREYQTGIDQLRLMVEGVGQDCTPGQTESCATGQPGICAQGSRTCSANGYWGSCVGPNPETEICGDDLDSDCDGNINNGCEGICDTDQDFHDEFFWCIGGGPNDDCDDDDATVYPGHAEICDGKDNNCDGVVDEGCASDSGVTRTTSSNTVEPGQTLTVDLAVVVDPASETFYAIEETVPEGWTVLNSGGGATLETNVLRWTVIEQAQSHTYTYTVQAPSSSSTYSFVGNYFVQGMGAPETTPGDSLVTVTQPQQYCSDQTLYGQCSNNQPLFCQDGNLMNNCQACGCPSGNECNSDGSCTTPPSCNDGDGDGRGSGCALGSDCNDNDPNVWDTQSCVYNGNTCGNYQLCLQICPIPPSEICTNGQDDDCDGQTDCEDASCSYQPECGGVPGGTGDIPPGELPPELWQDFEWVDPYPGGWTTIDVTTQGVVPNDGENDVPAINNILDGLAGPTILYFPEGTYAFNSGSVDKHDDVIYKGDGPDKTIFMLENDAGGLRSSGWWYDSTTVNADVPAYSRNIFVADTSFLLVGDFVRIYQQYDAGEGLKDTWGGVFEIVDVDSNSITVDTPIGLPLTASENPTVQEIRMIKNVGIEGIKFIRTSSDGGSTIIFSRTHNAYVDNVESYDTAKHHVSISWGHNIVIKNSYFDGSQFGGTGGFGYGIFAESLSTKIKAENNIMKDLRHQSVVQRGANNYIYAYNFHYDTPREICWYDIPTPSWCGSAQQIRDMWNSWRETDVAVHGNYPHNNLWEGNVMYVPGMDDSHGDNGPINTFFRNKAFGQPDSYSWIEGVGIFRERENEDHTIVGNMLYNDAILWIRNPVGDEQAFVGANLEQGQVSWGDLPVNAQLPASLYRTSPPSWWDGSEWPPFGPDVANSESNKIPAQLRYEARQGGA